MTAKVTMIPEKPTGITVTIAMSAIFAGTLLTSCLRRRTLGKLAGQAGEELTPLVRVRQRLRLLVAAVAANPGAPP